MGQIRKTLTFILMIFISAFIVLVSMPGGIVNAAELDRITDYRIKVDMLEDGSMSMEYTIQWSVLSNSGGPLTWVKIGIPNNDADQIEALSPNIKKARYYTEGGGDYIRVDFNTSYRAGDSFTFKFSFVQHNMFEESGSRCYYNFTPGWFDEIKVSQYTIYWNADNVIEADTAALIDGYYVWTGSLGFGQRTHTRVVYSSDAYNYTYKNVFHGLSGFFDKLSNGNGGEIGAIIIIMICFGVLSFRAGRYRSDGFHGGFGGGGFGGGGGCACACACACAGGGRAGCSKKDFYGTKISTARVRKILREQRKEDAERETV